MGKKSGICEHFIKVWNVRNLTVFTDTTFFAVFRANLLNKNDILAISVGRVAEKKVIFDQKRYI